MHFFNRAALVTAVLVFCLSAAGCSDNDKDKNNSTNSKPAADKSSSQAAGQDSRTDSSAEDSSDADPAGEDYSAGPMLTAMAERFEKPYTYSVKVTYSDEPDDVTEMTVASDGENYVSLSSGTSAEGLAPDSAYLYKDGKGSLADMNVGAYVETQMDTQSIPQSIIQNKLEQTNTRIPSDTEGMTVEEYTYTAASYITVYNFYFDSEGEPVKYTAVYSVEGEDDLVETVEITQLSEGADEQLFDGSFLDGLKDFSAMTEDERLAFCQQLCTDLNISTDDMKELDITPDDFKKISFDQLQTLVYTFGSKQ